MPHAAGTCLITITPTVLSTNTGTHFENVFHYLSATASADVDTIDAVGAAWNTYYSASYAGLLPPVAKYQGVFVKLDDGVNIVDGFYEMAFVGVTGASNLPEVMCGIVQKRAGGTSRRRFGHVCHGPLPDSSIVDPNTLTDGFITVLNSFYGPMYLGATAVGIADARMVLYNAAGDSTKEVFELRATAPIKTQRRRTPGRGI